MQYKTNGTLRRWQGPFTAPHAVPNDAVLIPIKEGLVVASQTQGQVLKIMSGEGKGHYGINRELRARAIAKEAGIAKHLPEIFASGEMKERPWTLMALAPNHYPANRRPRLWYRWLERDVLPLMQRFYEAGGVDVYDANTMFEKKRAQLQEAGTTPLVEQVLALCENARPRGASPAWFSVMCHLDLHPKHLHRTKSDWWLVDWGNLRRLPIHFELFRWYFRGRPLDRPGKSAFWAWLRGDIKASQLPRDVRTLLELYHQWQRAWRSDAPQTVAALRYTLLIEEMHWLPDVATSENPQGHWLVKRLFPDQCDS
jgi:hypothetical protein